MSIKFFAFTSALTSPGMVILLTSLFSIIEQYKNLGANFATKFTNVFSPEAIERVMELRQAQVEQSGLTHGLSKVFYNKFILVIDQVFDFLSLFSPRYYFQSGDSSAFSPHIVEPIAVLLFPFWIVGVIQLIKQGKRRVLFAFLGIAVFIYLFGQRNFAHLFPIGLFYVYFAYKGLAQFKNKKTLLALIVIYSLYIQGRWLWLR